MKQCGRSNERVYSCECLGIGQESEEDGPEEKKHCNHEVVGSCEKLLSLNYLFMTAITLSSQIARCFHSSLKTARMPPKKSSNASEKKLLLGRPGNNLKVGIVGLSTLHSSSMAIDDTFGRTTQRRKIVFLQRLVKHRFVDPSPLSSIFYSTLDLGKAANFPYATIDPEEARIPVPDTRFDWLCEVYKPASRVPAFLTCIDIAGLTAVRV